MLLVVGHFSPPAAPAWSGLLHDFIYTLHMPVFMAMSGYLYAASSDRRATALVLKKKFLRLMVPYFCLSVLITTVKLAASQLVTLENAGDPLTYLRVFYLPEAA